jgi:hypothetical protein
LRGIAPCGSCQGSLDNKPLLESQSEIHMKEQLQAFASEQRHNDISQQMRNIARAITPGEIEEAAAYYASQPARYREGDGLADVDAICPFTDPQKNMAGLAQRLRRWCCKPKVGSSILPISEIRYLSPQSKAE